MKVSAYEIYYIRTITMDKEYFKKAEYVNTTKFRDHLKTMLGKAKECPIILIRNNAPDCVLIAYEQYIKNL